MKTLIESNVKSTLPSLRLILTSQCGGQCKYCHNEGNNVDSVHFMPKEMVLQAACYAESINIPSICLTGGEPTLYPELAALIYKIQEHFKGDINMTTNGDRLRQCLTGFSELHTINLSLTSFDQTINSKYQNVDPSYAFESLLLFPAKNKNL